MWRLESHVDSQRWRAVSVTWRPSRHLFVRLPVTRPSYSPATRHRASAVTCCGHPMFAQAMQSPGRQTFIVLQGMLLVQKRNRRSSCNVQRVSHVSVMWRLSTSRFHRSISVARPFSTGVFVLGAVDVWNVLTLHLSSCNSLIRKTTWTQRLQTLFKLCLLIGASPDSAAVNFINILLSRASVYTYIPVHCLTSDDTLSIIWCHFMLCPLFDVILCAVHCLTSYDALFLILRHMTLCSLSYVIWRSVHCLASLFIHSLSSYSRCQVSIVSGVIRCSCIVSYPVSEVTWRAVICPLLEVI